MSILNMEPYIKKSEAIREQLLELRSVTQTLFTNNYGNEILEVIQNFNEDQFQLVVVGEFGRGKSTFINALLGKKILPSSAVPTTTIINKIQYHETPQYTLVYQDGNVSPRSISEEAFKAITAPPKPLSGDLNAEKKYSQALEEIKAIKFAEIGYPLPLLKNNVSIIDTPGTNDIDEMRVKITQDFMPQSDAAIFVLSAKKILAESEMDFLKWILKEDIQRIFFVINYSDVVRSEEARQKVLNYAKENLAEQFPNTKIYMISSKIALSARRVQQGEEVKGRILPFEESGFVELEEALSTFLMDERGDVKLEKPIAGGLRIANEMRQNIAIERQTLFQTVQELEKGIEQMKPELSSFRQSVEVIKQSYETMILNGKHEVSRILRLGLESVASTAVHTVQTYEGDLNGDAIQSAIESVVAPLQSTLQSDVRQKQQEIIEKALEQAQKRYVREWGKIEGALSSVLLKEIQNSPYLEHQQGITYDTSFETSNDDSIKTGIAAVGAGLIGLNVIGAAGLAGLFFVPILIPIAFIGIGGLLSSFFTNGTRQKIIAKVRFQVEDRYRGQIHPMIQQFEQQWEENASATAEHFFTEANKRVQTIENQLNGILEKKRREEEKASDREEQLKEAEQKILRIIESLQSINSRKSVEIV